MTDNLSPIIAQVLTLSKEESRRFHHPKVTSLALLLAMLRNQEGQVRQMIENLGAPVELLRDTLEQRMANASNPEIAAEEPQLDVDAERILRLSHLEARLQKSQETTDVHMLLALLRDRHNEACKLINQYGVEYKNITSNPTNSTPTTNQRSPENSLEMAGDVPSNNGETQRGVTSNSPNGGVSNSETPILDKFGQDLTQAAAQGWLDPIVGRHDEIQRVAQILTRRKKNNPILIGEPGVGKSALVEGLAQLIVKNQVPHLLMNKRIVTLDMASIVAGTQYRGQFEDRLRKLIEELKSHREIILFIDEIHTIIGAGSAPGSLDAANILKPALARGEVQCIGATTISEYRKTIEKDGALERRFQKIQLEPTTSEDTLVILNNIKARYEDHHNVTYTDAALQACVTLTERYMFERSLPDKAIDALDEAGSRMHLLKVQLPEPIVAQEKTVEALRQSKETAAAEQRYEEAAELRDQLRLAEAEVERLKAEWQSNLKEHRITVDEADIASVVSLMSGVPVERMQEEETIRLKGMQQALASKVIAQNRAIHRLTRAITRNRLGLKDPNRPIGTFMFVGPTGVGKTHLVKTLAEFMFGTKDSLIRIDMSEYGEKFSTSRLIGAPPGYVGYEEGGQLTEQVRRHPYSIILLDEIEKAHPDVFNTLLQVMDEGRMTDGNGTTVDFRNTVIIMTSNSGSRQVKEFGAGVGFGSSSDGISADAAESIVRKALQRQFAPEFLNRLDEIIMFDPLNAEGIAQIAELEIQALSKRLSDNGHQLELTPAAKQFVAKKAFDPVYGARSLRRTLQEYVEDPICDLFLDGEQKPVLHIDIDEQGKKLKLTSSDTL